MATSFENYVAGYWVETTSSFSTGGDNMTITRRSSGEYDLDYSQADFSDTPIILVTATDPDGGNTMRCATIQDQGDTACTITVKNSSGNTKDVNLNILAFIPS